MKLTSGDQTPLLATTAGNASSVGGIGVSGPALPGQGLLSNSSNTATWQPVVSTVTANGSNTLLGPNINVASGTGITLSVSSNTLNITATGVGGGSLEVQDEGTPLTTAADVLNFTGAGVTVSGTGATKTINISGGSGGSTDASGTLVQSIAWATVADTGTLVFGAAPTNGNTCYAFIVTNVVSVVSLVETNVTWTKIAKARVRNGNNMVLEIWKGVVAASASATITFDFDGNNVQAALVQEWSGLATVDAIQAALVNQTNVLQIENHNLAWSTPGGRAFLLWGNATGGAPATPPGWTASTGTPFNYGGTGYGSLYSIDASAIASLTATAYLPAVANDNITAILLHAKPTAAAAAVAYWPMLSLTSG